MIDETGALVGPGQSAILATVERFRVLGWGNDLTGVGGGADKSSYTTINRRKPLPSAALETVYAELGIAQRIVDRLCNDAIRRGFVFEDLPKGVARHLREIESDLETLGVLNAVRDADSTARLYGGSLLMPLTDDATPAEEPFDLSTVRNFYGFEIVASVDALPVLVEVNDKSPAEIKARKGQLGYTRPMQYEIYGDASLRGSGQIVHHSRVIRFEGEPIPVRWLRDNSGWRMSALNAPYDNVRRLGMIRAYIEAMAHDMSVGVLKVGGLGKKLLGGPEERSKARRAVQELRNMIDSLHWLAIDRDDVFELSSRPMQGLRDMEERAVEAVTMDTDYPREILTQATPGGLNSGSNEGPITSYYDAVDSRRQRVYTPAITRIADIYFAWRKLRPKTYTIGFDSLWTPTALESSQTRNNNATADATMIASGVATAPQLARQRIEDGTLLAPEPGEAPEAPAGGPAPADDTTDPAPDDNTQGGMSDGSAA